MSKSIPNHQSVTFETHGGPATVNNNAQYSTGGSPNNFIVNVGMGPSKPAGEYYVKNGKEAGKEHQTNYGSSHGQCGASMGKATSRFDKPQPSSVPGGHIGYGQAQPPTLPGDIIPLGEGGITEDHARSHFDHFWKLDDTADRTVQGNNASLECNRKTLAKFMVNLICLKRDIVCQGLKILRDRISTNFRNSGWLFKGQPVHTVESVRSLIKSPELKSHFHKNWRIPFELNVKFILSCTNLEDDWFYEEMRQWANNRSSLSFDFPKKVRKTAGDKSKLSGIIKVASSLHKQIFESIRKCEMDNFGMSVRPKKTTDSMRKKYFEVPIIMSNLGPVDTVKGLFLLVDKERYPRLKELKRDVVEADIDAMNTDPCHLHAFNLAKAGIVAGRTRESLTRSLLESCQLLIDQKILGPASNIANDYTHYDHSIALKNTPGQHFDPHNHHYPENRYAPGNLPSTVPYFHNTTNNYLPNQECFPMSNCHGGGEVEPIVQDPPFDLLGVSLDEYDDPYDVTNVGHYHKTLAESYQKPRTQVPVPTVDVIPPAVCISYFD